jgi:hexosaminidase
MAGLSTFVQLVNPVRKYLVPGSFKIVDEPSFSHRGLLLDTSRHFLPKDVILKHIETMAMTKLNVLHWHIVDDHSFPFQSSSFPNLTRAGAFAPSATYSHEDIRFIVEFAADRGIRVIPEIDIPGHTASWMRGYPELLGRAKSALDPTREKNYDFIESLLTEVRDVFKSDLFEGLPVIHVGGDETWDGWDTEAVRSWMTEHGMTTNKDLIQYWMRRISGIAKNLNIKLIMWEDFLETVKDDTSHFSDEDNHISWQTWRRDLSASIGLSKRINRDVIFSTDFYLDHLDLAWPDLYAVDMQQAPGLIGAEACMWGEVVDESNIYTRVWPRAAAVAERLWCGSQCALKASVDAAVRLARWRCRMIYFFRVGGMEPIGSVVADSPDRMWTYHTDREQWWCEEADI